MNINYIRNNVINYAHDGGHKLVRHGRQRLGEGKRVLNVGLHTLTDTFAVAKGRMSDGWKNLRVTAEKARQPLGRQHTRSTDNYVGRSTTKNPVPTIRRRGATVIESVTASQSPANMFGYYMHKAVPYHKDKRAEIENAKQVLDTVHYLAKECKILEIQIGRFCHSESQLRTNARQITRALERLDDITKRFGYVESLIKMESNELNEEVYKERRTASLAEARLIYDQYKAVLADTDRSIRDLCAEIFTRELSNLTRTYKQLESQDIDSVDQFDYLGDQIVKNNTSIIELQHDIDAAQRTNTNDALKTKLNDLKRDLDALQTNFHLLPMTKAEHFISHLG